MEMATARISLREEQDDLRSRMRALGMGHGEIAAEFARRYRFRPRAAWRHAHGWTLNQAARRVNDVAARTGYDEDGRAPMTGPRLCQLEQWPARSGLRPTPRVLALLAVAYGAPVGSLLDIDDHENYTAADRLVLDTMTGSGTPTSTPRATLSEIRSESGVRRTGEPRDGSLEVRDRELVRSAHGVVVVPVDRRGFLAGAGLVAPLAAMEPTRHTVTTSLAPDDGVPDVDEWRAIVHDYSLSYGSDPAADLLRRLDADLSILSGVARDETDSTVVRELRRIGALLAAFTAHATADVGDLASSRRWWRTAKRAADASGDVHARLWTRGREIVRALYEQRPVADALGLVAEADAVAASVHAPPAAVQDYLDGKARVLVRAGRVEEARGVLTEVQINFERLPPEVSGDTASWFGWSERALHLAESYTYSHLGDWTRADGAQTAASRLFPVENRRGPVLVDLQRALCQIRSGDIDGGIDQAYTAMTALPRAQYNSPIVQVSRDVATAVSPTESGRENVRAFRAYLRDLQVA
ncbi:Helix-turn-helix domain [Frankia torreyi]|uniref:Helix-turn-helix domain n=2 Tax=Frankia TaxID=1854 RepID=A0A0D8BB54_9ACTN|nr:Helix-turn-helix domain [Frankia torreyi]